jgi:acetolactate synthase-1/2/3 large subunit
MRVCDYIAERLYEYGIKNVYGLMGGGASGLNDGFIKNGKLNYVCFHHEQGAGHAAVGEAKLTNKLSVVNITTGCGGTNCVTSVLNAWQDCSPVIFISGNVRINQTSIWINKQKSINLRKYGLQEHNIAETVSNMTKYSVFIESIDDVAYELDKAIDLATSGRMGPVWIDIPGNIQTAPMPEKPRRYIPQSQVATITQDDVNQVLDMIAQAKRPLVLAGYGIHLSNTRLEFKKFIEGMQLPYVSTFNSRDLTAGSHPLNIGNIGVKGCRPANFAIQNCDLLLILGSSLNNSHVGYDEKLFAPHAKKVVIDIDTNEILKSTFDFSILSNLSDFFALCEGVQNDTEEFWRNKCLHWKAKWPVYQSNYRNDSNGINLYELVRAFDRSMNSNDIIMTDAGSPSYVCPVAMDFKENQKLILSPSQGDMGWAIPGSIGVALNTDKNVIVFIGDGSFYSNMQELAVARCNNLPIKFVIGNNNGYLSIKNTQTKFFQGRVYGVNDKTGLFFPDLEQAAKLFNLGYARITTTSDLDSKFEDLIHSQESMIIEVMLQETQDILPTIALLPSGRQGGLHELFPFLSDEELAEEMIVKI